MNNEQMWTADMILETARQYQAPAVLLAAAELDVFDHLRGGTASAADLASKLQCDQRGMQILLDALTAMHLIHKSEDRYELSAALGGRLTAEGRDSVVGMLRHQANCFRSWGELARVVKTGAPAARRPSVRGGEGDTESFIEAMHNVSAAEAPKIIQAIQPLSFRKLVDIGGASGTWTMAFLRACPTGRGVLFDLPEVIPLARRRLEASGFSQQVELVSGDYNKDELPAGCDLAWLSAIAHQNSMHENLDLFRRIHAALEPGGRIAIRDIVMEENRVQPPSGAFFAVNMLVNTPAGATYTFQETKNALEHAGFSDVRVARRDQGMHSIIVARKTM